MTDTVLFQERTERELTLHVIEYSFANVHDRLTESQIFLGHCDLTLLLAFRQ